jgi:glyoxylase-like metal-dependent hydrolase (beta-lactamase superfamily II)
VKVHYLNCGTMYPPPSVLFAPHLDRSPCLCLLIEAQERLILVDTGFGTRDMEDLSRLGPGRVILKVIPRLEETAIKQIEGMGLRPGDVSDIICTHLDRDHAGGLGDFPNANVHVTRAERDAALHPQSGREKERYRPVHFEHGPKWVTYETETEEEWFGLPYLKGVGLPAGIVLVPLPGHTRGHCGVAIDTGDGWILHCGDAYYIKEELRLHGTAPIGVRGFRKMAHISHGQAMKQIEGLKRLTAEGNNIKMIAAHDQFEYRNLFGKPLE